MNRRNVRDTHDGPLVEVVEGANDDIRIKLHTSGGAAEEIVTIDLSANS